MDSREELIKKKILEEERREILQLSGIRMKVWDILTKEKGFTKEDIEVDPEFELKLSDCTIKVSIDFLVKIPELNLMIIRCSPTSIESWERYILAFARVVKEHQIPFAIVTDGERARIIDVLNNRLIGESVKDIPAKEDLLNSIKELKKIPFPSEKLEREKRIVYAFEGVKCEIKQKSNI